MPNVAALRRVLNKLQSAQIPHYAWTEPDFDFGLTAIATAPIHGAQREALMNYRVYVPIAQPAERPNSNSGNAGSNPAGRTNAGMVEC